MSLMWKTYTGGSTKAFYLEACEDIEDIEDDSDIKELKLSL